MCNKVSSLRFGYFRFTNLHSEIKMPRNALKLPPAMASDSFVCLEALGSSVAVSVSLGLLAIMVACAEHRPNGLEVEKETTHFIVKWTRNRWRDSTQRDAEI